MGINRKGSSSPVVSETEVNPSQGGGTPQNKPKQARDALGRLLPGSSGNPGGRPGELGEFRRQCREHGPKALAGLLAAIEEGGAHGVAAARVVLEYAYGKPQAAPEDNEALAKSGGLPLTREELLKVARGEKP